MRINYVRVLQIITYVGIAFILVFFVMIYLSEKEKKSPAYDEKITVLQRNKEVTAICDCGESIWVGGTDGITIYDKNTKTLKKVLDNNFKIAYAGDIIKTQNDEIWVGHNEGITIYDKDFNEQNILFPDIPKGRVNCLLELEESVWLGTLNGACEVSKKDHKVLRTLTQENGLLTNHVNVISLIDEEIWFGSYLDSEHGGISILQSYDIWDYITTKNGISHPYINSILQKGNHVYVGTGQLMYGGLSELEKKDKKWFVKNNYSIEDGIPGEKVRQLFLDSNNKLWITTESNGLIICNYLSHPINCRLITEDNGISDNEIKDIVETEDDYWLAGRYGISIINKTSKILSDF